jgi:hypothetical protein
MWREFSDANTNEIPTGRQFQKQGKRNEQKTNQNLSSFFSIVHILIEG